MDLLCASRKVRHLFKDTPNSEQILTVSNMYRKYLQKVALVRLEGHLLELQDLLEK
jgi:hypothetical protein